MKNTIICLAIVLIGSVSSQAQYWNEIGNNSIIPSTMMLGTTDNTPIPFRTNDTERMRLWNGSNATITGGGTGSPYTVNQGGMLGIFASSMNVGPYSLLHLNGINSGGSQQQTGYRDWMKYGISFTHNKDFMYVGPWSVGGVSDQSRAVIAWSDNATGGSGPDDFSFLFTSSGSGESGDTEGQELMRVAGAGNIGIGNFQSNGLNEPPSYRLDVDGQVRIREIKEFVDPVETRDCILVGDWSESPYSTDDHVVKRINFSSDSDEYFGGDGEWHPISGLCNLNDWNADGNGIRTGTSTDCNIGSVGIGQSSSIVDKLAVYQIGFNDNATTARGIRSTIVSPVLNSYTWRTAVQGDARYGRYVFGGDFSALNESVTNTSTVSCGVRGTANYGKQAFGVYGYARNGDVNTIGVYGHASSNFGLVHAGYFAGQLVSTQPVLTISDETLKQEIADIENALGIIQLLQPKSYQFLTEEHPNLGLAEGLQYGFIAQEIELVLPEAVKPVMSAYSLDSLGVFSNEETTYKGVTYAQLIPLLTQGIKEQQTQIETLNARVDEMEALLAGLDLGKSMDSDNTESMRSDYELYQNRPNPFSTSTEIVWRMAEEAQARIIVHNQQGITVATLQDGNMSKGLHSIEWQAGDLPAGTYLYSLEVNDQLMVKRAIKLER